MAILGCIADDFTGATDLAAMLVRNGMSAIQTIGVPAAAPDADAIVVALKSRTAPVQDAVSDSLAALRALQAAGCRQFLFKVCSTFDSTDAGNIGPVADALMHALGAALAPVTPAFPANGRTVYLSHLFVGQALLNESGMQDHPLTPMRDANLVRVLGRQTDGRVGAIGWPVVARGADAVRHALAAAREQGMRYAIVDAISDHDLRVLGAAAAELPLLVGGSGIAMGLPENFRRAGILPSRDDAGMLPPVVGPCAVVAGSCSRMTLLQVATARDLVPTLEIDPLQETDGPAAAARAIAWARARLSADRPVVIAVSQPPDRVAAVQARLGRAESAALIENLLATVAASLVYAGVTRLVVAGGETAGAVVGRLGVRSLRIGAEIDPGVPWTLTDRGLLLALKSGNFGGRDFFLRAFA